VILSNCCRTRYQTVPNSTVLFLKNCHFSNTVPNTVLWKIFNMFDSIKLIRRQFAASNYQTWKKIKFYNKVWCLYRRKQTSNTEKTLILLKKNIMFYKFDTIKFIKNFRKYSVWYCVWKMTVFQKKYGMVLFGTVWYLWRQQFERITVW